MLQITYFLQSALAILAGNRTHERVGKGSLDRVRAIIHSAGTSSPVLRTIWLMQLLIKSNSYSAHLRPVNAHFDDDDEFSEDDLEVLLKHASTNDLLARA